MRRPPAGSRPHLYLPLYPSLYRPLYRQVDLAFRVVWADHGDEVSRQYAGTGAMKSAFTRTGKRDLWGLLDDGAKSLTRCGGGRGGGVRGVDGGVGEGDRDGGGHESEGGGGVQSVRSAPMLSCLARNFTHPTPVHPPESPPPLRPPAPAPAATT